MSCGNHSEEYYADPPERCKFCGERMDGHDCCECGGDCDCPAYLEAECEGCSTCKADAREDNDATGFK